MNDNEPDTGWLKSFRQPEYWLLLVTAAGGCVTRAWWVVIPLCVAGLSISALPKYIKLWPRAESTGHRKEWFATVGLSLLNSSGVASAAYMIGVIIRWVLG